MKNKTMKKLLFILLLLSCISTLSYSQSKTEFGVATEGSWFTPRPYSEHSDQNRNGWGAGMGPDLYPPKLVRS